MLTKHLVIIKFGQLLRVIPYICALKIMRNYIVYFLTALFLLFVVESKINVRTLNSNSVSHSSQKLPKRANRLNQTYEKLSIQQSFDDVSDACSLELYEEDFQFSDTLQSIAVLACVFTLIYVYGLESYKKLKPTVHGFLSKLFNSKRFILIRSIRI